MRASNVLQLAPAFRIAYVNAITVPFVTGIDDYMEIARGKIVLIWRTNIKANNNRCK